MSCLSPILSTNLLETGLAVGLHLLAYGAEEPVPFQRAICQSQALEPGITGTFTINAMQALVDHIGCDGAGLHSEETVECLRGHDTQALLDSAIATKLDGIESNIGDIWLPVVDGDFLPAAPSELIREGRFAQVPTMMSWTDDDLNFFIDLDVKTAEDTHELISAYVPGVTSENVDALLALYPVADFSWRENEVASAELFRSGRIIRDIIMVCEPLWYAENLARHGNKEVYLVDWNQTVLEPLLEEATGVPGLGPVHTAEFAYVFGNVSVYDIPGSPFDPTEEDFALAKRGSRSWSTFATTGKPSLDGHDTFEGFAPAFKNKKDIYVFVAGGPEEGLSAVDGPHSSGALGAQKLAERCDFINMPEMIEQLGF